MSSSIEDVVLYGEQRGISTLRPWLAPDFCADAARFALDRSGPLVIATGFYILSGGSVETDGPPGALALGRAFEALGREVIYVTDAHATGVLAALVGSGGTIADFPITDIDASETFARHILQTYEPGLLIAIERCAPSADGLFRNMRGRDITPFTARIDRLFAMHDATIGIGDGGNEIGMGSLAEAIAAADKLPDLPAVTPTTKLVVAGVSNWGAWGLLAAISRLAQRDLLPDPDEEWSWVERCVEAGAVDGFSGERVAKVDGMSRDEYQRPLRELRETPGPS